MRRRLDGVEDPPPGRPPATATDGALVVVEEDPSLCPPPAPTPAAERAYAGIPPPPPPVLAGAPPPRVVDAEDDEPLTAWLDSHASASETVDAGDQSRSGVSTGTALQWGVLAVIAAMAANVISFRYSRAASRGRPSGGPTIRAWRSSTPPGSGGGGTASSSSAGPSSSSSSPSWGRPFSPWMGSSGDPRPDATPGAASARADAWAASVRAEAVRRAAARAAAAASGGGSRPAAARGRWERVTTVRGPDGRVHTTRQSGATADGWAGGGGSSPFAGGLPDMAVLEQLLRAQQAAARRAGGGGAGLGDAFRFWEGVFMGQVPGAGEGDGGDGGPRARPRDGGGPSSSSYGGGSGGGGYAPTPSAARPDYYGALGVAPGASAAELRAAYLRTARASHPDTYRGGDAAGAAERFRRASAAYEVLRDKDLRARYDAGL